MPSFQKGHYIEGKAPLWNQKDIILRPITVTSCKLGKVTVTSEKMGQHLPYGTVVMSQ